MGPQSFGKFGHCLNFKLKAKVNLKSELKSTLVYLLGINALWKPFWNVHFSSVATALEACCAADSNNVAVNWNQRFYSSSFPSTYVTSFTSTYVSSTSSTCMSSFPSTYVSSFTSNLPSLFNPNQLHLTRHGETKIDISNLKNKTL